MFIFLAPRLTYLAVAALCGACYFGSTLVTGVTISTQGLLAATIGCACWTVYRLLIRQSAGEQFRQPWSRSAVALMALALVAETTGVMGATAGIAIGSVTFGLLTVLALLISFEIGTPSWAYVVFLSFFELTICATGLARPGRVVHGHELGMLLIGNSLLFLATLEAVQFLMRHASGHATQIIHPRWAGAFWSAANRFAIVATAVADCLAILDIDRAWQSGLIFLVGSISILWATRVVRRNALVYAGLVHLAAGALDLTWWTASPVHADMRLAWIALAAALVGLLLVITGAVTRRLGLSEFYTRPCFQLAVPLTAVAFIAAIDARFLGRESFRLGVLALATNALVTLFVLVLWRRAELAYAAVFHVVAATYLVLFSTGKNDPAMAYVLGLTAVVEALMLWCAGLWCRRLGRPIASGCAGPLCHWAVFMTALAVVLCAHSPLTLALVGVSLLLAIKGLPRAEWLYGAVAACTVAGYWKWLERVSAVPLLALALLLAFGLWGLAVLAQSYKPAICRRLGLVALAYELPLFHSATAAGALALLLRVNLSLSNGAEWTAYVVAPACACAAVRADGPRLSEPEVSARGVASPHLVDFGTDRSVASVTVLDHVSWGGARARAADGRAGVPPDRAGALCSRRSGQPGLRFRDARLGLVARRLVRVPGHVRRACPARVGPVRLAGGNAYRHILGLVGDAGGARALRGFHCLVGPRLRRDRPVGSRRPGDWLSLGNHPRGLVARGPVFSDHAEWTDGTGLLSAGHRNGSARGRTACRPIHAVGELE